jgi:hypothetical protein
MTPTYSRVSSTQIGFGGSPRVVSSTVASSRLNLGNELKNFVWLGRCEQRQVIASALSTLTVQDVQPGPFPMISHFRLRRLEPVSSESGRWRDFRWSHIGSGNNISFLLLRVVNRTSCSLIWCNNAWSNKQPHT